MSRKKKEWYNESLMLILSKWQTSLLKRQPVRGEDIYIDLIHVLANESIPETGRNFAHSNINQYTVNALLFIPYYSWILEHEP